jgi:carbamoyl-phosphate synthase large subunit
VAQTRRRLGWAFSSRAPAGVTGVTHVAVTACDPSVDSVAERAIRSIDAEPHGLFGVDMTLDHEGNPNLTEINIGRFFTTIYFFTKAGLNMPLIYRDLALEGRRPQLARKLNPLPPDKVWIRGMDVEPRLVDLAQLSALERGANGARP